MKVLRRQKARRIAQVAADNPAAFVQGVRPGVPGSETREIRLQLDSGNPDRGVTLREKEPDHADAGAKVENALPRTRPAEVGEQERIETVTVPALGLPEDQPPGFGQDSERAARVVTV